jgi:hypothetical protein
LNIHSIPSSGAASKRKSKGLGMIPPYMLLGFRS